MTLNLAGQFRALVMAVAVGLTAAPTAHAADAAIPTTPEAGSFKIGIEPWLG
ncbi:ABC transporter substrate-binding protein, partial [Mesorhizobium sp. M1C.F.Ca.ET.187.01.1.1]